MSFELFAPTQRSFVTRTITALVSIGFSTSAFAADVGIAGGSEFNVLIVSFLFLMGVSQAGVVFCAICRLCYSQWAKPFYRLAELCTVAFAPFAIVGFLLIYFYAKNDLFYWMSAEGGDHLSPWLDGDWFLIRHLIGLSLFYGLSLVYVFKGLRPDLASDSGDNHRRVERQLYLLSPWVLVSFLVCNTFFAWDFGMMLIPHWHSTVFPIHFWFGNIFAFTAVLTMFPVLLRWCSKSEFPFGARHVRQLSMLITSFVLLWLYFYWAQFFVIWFGNMPHEYEPLWRQSYGHYAPYYWAMMAACFFIPLIALTFNVFNRSVAAMCVIGVAINLGVWLNKYLMVVPVFLPDARPLDHLVDAGLSVALLVGFLGVVFLLARWLPIYSFWEMKLTREPEV